MNVLCERAAEGLRRRGFAAVLAADRREALELVMAEAAGAESVGWGGSETLKEIGARDALAASGAEIRDHRTVMDVFLLSANALTADGVIVNIDGTGNRVAASIFGPKKVVYVVGRNKIVEGGVAEAVARAKRMACPPNCRRLGKKTPCAAAGECLDCDSPDRICKVTAVFDRAPTHTPTKVILVDEDLGY
ncbi:MAG: lactate utilization protein [Kiritimatiellae bacterium]|nr:lactate utilization protein [Kiritimatiellia bacterium]